MRPVFKDPDLQATFDRLGYAPIPGFLTPELVAELKQTYFDLLPESGGSLLSEEADFQTDAAITYDFTFIDRNSDYKQKVFDAITARFKDIYGRYLDNYKPIIANFIRKEEDSGEVPLHQNWAFVDERKYTSVSIWVPLVDSNEANGTLQMVDGSHKRFGELRGPLVPWELDKIGPDIIANYLTPMNVSAGDAVILDDSIVHYSNVNTTSGLRLTIQLILVPAEIESIHYHLSPDGDRTEVTVYEVDRDFYMGFHPWKKPEGKILGTRPFQQNYLTRAEFDARLAQPPFDRPELSPEKPQGLLGRLKSLFS